MKPTYPKLLPTLLVFLLTGLVAATLPHPALGPGLPELLSHNSR